LLLASTSFLLGIIFDPGNRGNMSLQNVRLSLNYTASKPRRLYTSDVINILLLPLIIPPSHHKVFNRHFCNTDDTMAQFRTLHGWEGAFQARVYSSLLFHSPEKFKLLWNAFTYLMNNNACHYAYPWDHVPTISNIKFKLRKNC
jgi:hypothetical protein